MNPRFLPAGDAALSVAFGTAIDAGLSRHVFSLHAALERDPFKGYIASIPTFGCLTVQFDPLTIEPDEVETAIKVVLDGHEFLATGETRHWRIPVCYDADLSPDLGRVAEHTGMTPGQYAARHQAQDYLVYMVGGFPGFPHMGDLPDALRVPRLESPRLRVAAGSIAVAGRLTAIYPIPTPGGWNLIGRTPVSVFDADRDCPALIGIGDTVRFAAITREEYAKLQARADNGQFTVDELRPAP